MKYKLCEIEQCKAEAQPATFPRESQHWNVKTLPVVNFTKLSDNSK